MSKSRKLKLTSEDINRAAEEVEAQEKIKRRRPRWQDYVDEGVIDAIPEPDADGVYRAKINGHGNVVRSLMMNEEANRHASWHADNRFESSEMRDLREERRERRERKFFKPKATFVVPDLPWKKKDRGGD